MIIRDAGETGTAPDPTAPNAGARPAESHIGETAPADRHPKGDHNRRLALGLDIDAFAAEAGVTAEALRDYEGTWPDHDFDLDVASRVGAALHRLERDPPPSQKVSNGPVT